MPNRFIKLNASAPQERTIAQMNENFAKLDGESVTKKFGKGANQVVLGKAGAFTGMVVGDPTKEAIIYGRYMPNRLGTLKIQAGVPVSLDGQHPVDGHQGYWIVVPGKNVITELGGIW